LKSDPRAKNAKHFETADVCKNCYLSLLPCFSVLMAYIYAYKNVNTTILFDENTKIFKRANGEVYSF